MMARKWWIPMAIQTQITSENYFINILYTYIVGKYKIHLYEL